MWQPIETAPKDGTEFDGWAIWFGEDEGQRIPNVAWGRGYVAFESERGEIEGWIAEQWGIDGSLGAMDPEEQRLTHWMPIPDGPTK